MDDEGAKTVTSVAEQRLMLALQAAELGTWTWDMASATTTWDARLEALHGLPPGGFGGTFEDWVAALHPDDRAECIRRVERALADPGPYVLLHRCTWPDGSIHWIECRGSVTVDAEGAPTGTLGVAIDVTAREQRVAAVARELEEEHHLVEALQRAILPSALPSVANVTLAIRYVAAAGRTVVGGDWYAAVPLADGRLGLAIGDVAGHGLPAVADMADARFSLRALALGEQDPARVLARLSHVVELFEDDTLITTLYGMIDPVRHTWSYASAGHLPPVLRLADGTTTLLPWTRQPPLGFPADYERFTTPLPAGATIVLYTDGLVERRGESIDAGLQRLVAACRDGSPDPEKLCDQLLGLLLGEDSNHDDAALLVATLAASSQHLPR
jgi:PAS domain S-box-containing protein